MSQFYSQFFKIRIAPVLKKVTGWMAFCIFFGFFLVNVVYAIGTRLDTSALSAAEAAGELEVGGLYWDTDLLLYKKATAPNSLTTLTAPAGSLVTTAGITALKSSNQVEPRRLYWNSDTKTYVKGSTATTTAPVDASDRLKTTAELMSIDTAKTAVTRLFYWDTVLNQYFTGLPDNSLDLLVNTGIITISTSGGTNETTLDITASITPQAGFVSHITDWRLDGTSIATLNMPMDSNANDYSTYGNDAVVSGATHLTTGCKVGGCYDFDGVNDYITIGDLDAIDTPGYFTASLWFNRDNDVSDTTNHGIDNVLFAKSSSASNDNLEIGSSGSTLQIYLDATSDLNIVEPDLSLANDTWYHLVVVYDKDQTNELIVYLDGSSVYTASTASGALTSATSSPFGFGLSRIGSDNWGAFDGMMDEIMIFTKALSTDQIIDIYNAGVAGHQLETIASTETEIDDVWTVNVTPNDGSADGTSELSNALTVVAPAGACDATTVSNCDVEASLNTETSGVCGIGYSGSCSYTCTNGSWTTPSSNTCAVTAFSATGGTVTTINDGGTDYKVHTFTSDGTFTVTGGGNVEYLVVGGGGGVGNDNRAVGGGGGGGVLTGSMDINDGVHTITVGDGGLGGYRATSTTAATHAETAAGSSSLGSYVLALGGGADGYSNEFKNGATGGGASVSSSGVNSNGIGVAGQGYNGGAGSLTRKSGGGGGAGGPGEAGGPNSGMGGDGGIGIQSDINGTATYYGGGGGGCGYSAAAGSGGLGGGANGSTGTATSAQNGTPNTGGGAGGARSATVGRSGSGGSGIVIIRYPL